MTEKSKRSGVIAEMMQRKLSHVIQQEINDPRLSGLLTLSGIEVNRDLSHAKIFFTVFNDDPKEVELLLNKASSFLRSALARTSTLRTVPQLHFIYDESIAYGQRLSQLIDAANPPDDDAEASN